MRITVLGSGSGGNCTLVESGNTALLIDAGLSCRQITQRLAHVGRTLDDIAGILLTHEHGDHTSALPVLCKTRPVTVYANRLTAEEIQPAVAGKVHVPWQVFTTGSGFTVGDLKVEAFSVPHDAQDPVGFIIHNSAVSAGFVTDLGQVTRLVTDRVRALDALVLEANHDVQMLQNDPHRSWGTKQRILGRHGHLSNEDAAKLAGDVATDRLRYLVLAHLSQDCNEPKLAHAVVTRQLHAAGATHVHVSTARQHEPIGTVRL